VLDPILANVEMQAVPIVRLGAAGTVEATILVVHLEDDPCAIDEFPCLMRTRVTLFAAPHPAAGW
jgi:hypothetical protein